jgi:MFS family permease
LNTLLLRFVVTASLARLVNDGLTLALVLVTLSRAESTAQAGVLVAASTLPQLVTGPLLGQVLDRAPHPWALLRLAGAVTAASAALLAATAGRAPLAVPLAGALAISCAEPLLTGGLSAVAGRAPWSNRVFAWDSLTYNIAGLAGPAVVTVVAALTHPAWTLVVLGTACGAIALTSLGLTAEPSLRPAGRAGGWHLAAALRAIVRAGPLRSATVTTTVAFAALGGLEFALVAAVGATGRPATDAGIALTVTAAGGLVGSLAMTYRAAPARPERTVLLSVAAIGAVLVAMAAGSWPLLLTGAVAMGILDGPLLVGLFTTRSEHSPAALRATVFTIGTSAKLGASSLGAIIAGTALDDRSTGAGLLAIGAVHLTAAAIGWLNLRPRRSPLSGPPPTTQQPQTARVK